MHRNRLYYGDNLPILREQLAEESVDLVYLDPPFNSNRDYNVLFRDESGNGSDAQILAFGDTWHWGPAAEATWETLTLEAPAPVATALGALLRLLGRNQMMAYLVMMTARLLELHRVLKPTGSLYLHCDPTASHYLKIVLDTIFDVRYFRNEIIWGYTGPGSPSMRQFNRKHDTIFWYSKGKKWTFNKDDIRLPHKDGGPHAGGFKGAGKKSDDPEYARKGKVPETWWTDIAIAPRSSRENTKYPTQKPLKLLERIIRASSNPGDIVLDPFCGCGTAIVAAERLKRRWLGIDITHLSVSMMAARLAAPVAELGCSLQAGRDYDIIGVPNTLTGARQLARDDPFQFQFWATSLVAARPLGGKNRRGADGGIDGVIPFIDGQGQKRRSHQALVQVKSGKVGDRDIRDLRGAMEAAGAPIALFLTLNPPTRPMLRSAAAAGNYRSENWSAPFPRVQILGIEQLLEGARPRIPGRFEQQISGREDEEAMDELL